MDDVIDRLRDISGKDNVISDKDRLKSYAYDESGIKEPCMPDIVIKPSSAAEISAILRLAGKERIPVTVRGAGSNLVGSCLPASGGILLSTERMNRILEIDDENMVAVVEPGVITGELCKAAEARSLYYAGYPMSVETSTIGGNVAHNAGGGRS